MKSFIKGFLYGLNPFNWSEILRKQTYQDESNCSGNCNQGRCCDCKNRDKM